MKRGREGGVEEKREMKERQRDRETERQRDRGTEKHVYYSNTDE
jgi:hypothetical protein